MSDWNMYDTLSESKRDHSVRTNCCNSEESFALRALSRVQLVVAFFVFLLVRVSASLVCFAIQHKYNSNLVFMKPRTLLFNTGVNTRRCVCELKMCLRAQDVSACSRFYVFFSLFYCQKKQIWRARLVYAIGVVLIRQRNVSTHQLAGKHIKIYFLFKSRQQFTGAEKPSRQQFTGAEKRYPRRLCFWLMVLGTATYRSAAVAVIFFLYK